MTTYLPDEAVEAAARAWYKRSPHILSWMQLTDDERYGWREMVRPIVTAAAPYIAAQARAMPAKNLQIVNGWLVERGAHDLDYLAGAAYGPYPDSDAEPLVKLDELPGWPGDAANLRARIEAVRDAWRAGRCACLTCTATRRHADALDALLRGA